MGCSVKPAGSCTREGPGTHRCLNPACKVFVHNLCSQKIVCELAGSAEGDFFCSKTCILTVREASQYQEADYSSGPVQVSEAGPSNWPNITGAPWESATVATPSPCSGLVLSSGLSKPNGKGGRRQSPIKKLFEESRDPVSKALIGMKCLRCRKVRHDKKVDGSLLCRHIYSICPRASYEDRLLAWRSSKPLRTNFPEPQPPLPSRVLPVSAAIPEGMSLVPEEAVEGQVVTSQDGNSAKRPPPSGRQMFVKNFADRVDSKEIDKIQKLLMEFFVAHNIAFSTVDSPSFRDFVNALRPAFVSAGGLPNRYKLGGAMLDELYEEVRAKVLALIRLFLAQGGRMTLMLDSWENPNHAHLINFLSVVGNVVVFMDSVMIGDVNQTAENQAEAVQDILDPFGGVKAFAGIVTDNTQSCLNMRDLIVERNPGIVSLNDQAHVTNLLFGDLGGVPYISHAITSSESISVYVRGHQYVLALYTNMKRQYNAVLKQQNSTTDRAVNFTRPASTRFCMSLDGMERGMKNRKVVRDMVDDKTVLQSKLCLTTSSARERLEHFCALVDNKATWEDMANSIAVLKHVRVYLRLWDADRFDLSTVVSSTTRMYFAIREEVEGLLVGSRRFGKAVGDAVMFAVQTRIYGPVSSSVKVLLLEDIHFLASILSPATKKEHFAELEPRAVKAFSRFLANSSELFPENNEMTNSQRLVALDERVALFRKELLVFIAGTNPSLLVGRESCKDVGSPEEFAGFWILYGKDFPLLQKCAIWVSHLSASSCPAERSFSAQGDTHTLKRNRLLSERVKKLVYCRWNLRLFKSMSPALQDAVDELFQMDGALKEMLDAEEEVEVLDLST